MESDTMELLRLMLAHLRPRLFRDGTRSGRRWSRSRKD